MALALAQPMNIEPALAVETLLRRFEGSLVEKHNPNGNSRWIMPLGVWHRRRRLGGLQFCPACLSTDPIPYFRKRWRLSFVTVCETHGVFLSDRCSRCDWPVQYHCLAPTAVSLRNCPFCGFDLAETLPTAASKGRAFALQVMLLDAAYRSWGTHAAFGTRHALLIFPVIARLTALLLSRRRIAQRFQRAAFARSGVAPLPTTSTLEFDRLPADQRALVLEAVGHLLDEWPSSFAAVCEDASAGITVLLDEHVKLPFWYESEVRAHFDRQPYVETISEFLAALDYLERHSIAPSLRVLRQLFGKDDVLRKRPAWRAIVRQRFPDEYDQLYRLRPG